MRPSVTTFLMFEGKAEEAMNFYVSLFPNSAVTAIARYGPDGPGAEGSVMHARFSLNGREFRCIGRRPRPDAGRCLSVQPQVRLGERPLWRLVAAEPAA